MAKKTDKPGKPGKSKKALIEPTAPLVLELADGKPAFTCQPEVVDTYRHMLSVLIREQPLPNRLGMIAALPEEGVTYSSLALALTLANDRAMSVCVVELNWWRPGLAKLIGGVDSPGLAGAASAEEAILRTARPNLCLIPAGDLPVADRPIRARSQQIREEIDTLSRQFDMVVLDVPAILSTSDAIPLASLAEACCLVIQQGATPVTVAKRALDDVRHLRMLGVVLNRVRIATPRLIRKWIPQE